MILNQNRISKKYIDFSFRGWGGGEFRRKSEKKISNALPLFLLRVPRVLENEDGFLGGSAPPY